jgi:hemerythrin-like domain-containing protein
MLSAGRDTDVFVKIGQPADHGFNEPLGLLSDCHRRIEGFLAVLLQIADAGRGGILQQADREALSVALHYFRAAAPRHTADEEQSLFPRLRRAADRQTQTALEVLDRLEAEHRAADAHHQAVDALGSRWLSEGALPAGDAITLRDHLAALHELYQTHIAVEDQQLFPAAARVLRPAEIERIGREMAARRGVAYAPPAATPHLRH